MFGLGPTLASLFKYLYFLRFPLLLGLLPLWGLAYLGYYGPTTFRNVMLVSHPLGFISVGAQVASLSIIVYLSCRIVLRNAEARFDVQPWRLAAGGKLAWRGWVPLFLAIIGGPLLVVVALANEETCEYAGLYLFEGFLVTAVTIRGLREIALRTAGKFRPVGSFGRGMAQFLGDGYYDFSKDQFRQGHSFMFFAVLAALGTYLFARLFLHPDSTLDADHKVFPALFFLLTVPIVLVSILSGMGFFLDRFRVPVFGMLILMGFLNYHFWETDHVFKVYPARPLGTFNLEAQAEESEEAAQMVRQKSMGQREPSSDFPQPSEGGRPDRRWNTGYGGAFRPGGFDNETPSTVVSPVVAQRAAFRRLQLMNSEEGDNNGTVILVCASGGGIQAAGWTARVLAGMDEATYGEFSKRLFFFSSASGGSVGGYYYMESFDRTLGYPNRDRIQRIFPAATTSSLESALWGLTQPDFTRFFFPSPLQDQTQDRASSVEESWRRQANFVWDGVAERTADDHNGRDKQFGEWIARTRDGVLPALVFNSIIVETGELMAISTVDFTPISDGNVFAEILESKGIDIEEFRARAGDREYRQQIFRQFRNDPELQKLREERMLPSSVRDQTFHRIFSDPDQPDIIPDISKRTAARLSATFPYITPISRPQLVDGFDYNIPYWHIADGGFYDNLGIVPAIEWIRSVIFGTNGMRGQVNRVVVIQIIPEPEFERPAPPYEGETKVSRDGFRYQLYGPAEAITKVRGATQVRRSDMELGLLEQLDDLNDAAVNVEVVRLQPPAEIYEDEGRPPLSWSLSPSNIRALDDAWDSLAKNEESELSLFLTAHFPGWTIPQDEEEEVAGE